MKEYYQDYLRIALMGYDKKLAFYDGFTSAYGHHYIIAIVVYLIIFFLRKDDTHLPRRRFLRILPYFNKIQGTTIG